MAYTATLRAAADDGVNTYLIVEVSDGARTMPKFQLVMPTGSSRASINTLLQNIATNQPTVASAVQSLINVPVLGL